MATRQASAERWIWFNTTTRQASSQSKQDNPGDLHSGLARRLTDLCDADRRPTNNHRAGKIRRPIGTVVVLRGCLGSPRKRARFLVRQIQVAGIYDPVRTRSAP